MTTNKVQSQKIDSDFKELRKQYGLNTDGSNSQKITKIKTNTIIREIFDVCRKNPIFRIFNIIALLIIIGVFLFSKFNLETTLFTAFVLISFEIGFLFLIAYALWLQNHQQILSKLKQIQQDLKNKSGFNKNKQKQEYIEWNGFLVRITPHGIFIVQKDGKEIRLKSVKQLQEYILNGGKLKKIEQSTSKKPLRETGGMGTLAYEGDSKRDIRTKKQQARNNSTEIASSGSADEDIILRGENRDPDLRHCIMLQLSEEERLRRERLKNQEIDKMKEEAIEQAIKEIQQAREKEAELEKTQKIEQEAGNIAEKGKAVNIDEQNFVPEPEDTRRQEAWTKREEIDAERAEREREALNLEAGVAEQEKAEKVRQEQAENLGKEQKRREEIEEISRRSKIDMGGENPQEEEKALENLTGEHKEIQRNVSSLKNLIQEHKEIQRDAPSLKDLIQEHKEIKKTIEPNNLENKSNKTKNLEIK